MVTICKYNNIDKASYSWYNVYKEVGKPVPLSRWTRVHRLHLDKKSIMPGPGFTKGIVDMSPQEGYYHGKQD